jgi:Xaa-Pro aminopeptidase
MLDIEKPRTALREEGLAAWLLCNLFHRDEIADLVLEVPARSTNTRPWVCLLFRDRPPVKIVHRIEASILDHVPGETLLYSTRDEYTSALLTVIPAGSEVAADFSSVIPVGSFLDHGTALLMQDSGCRLLPAENLVARCLGTLDDEGRRSHSKAASVLFDAVREAWALVVERLGGDGGSRRPLREGEIRDLITSRIVASGLVSDGPPIVGFGVHSSNPHHSVPGAGALISPGDVVQLDMWAKDESPGAVYADISWIGVAARDPSPAQAKAFDAVVRAREAGVETLERGLAQGKGVRGAEVDAAVRHTLVDLGYGDFLRHRTGHSIGRRVHDFGVNLDSVEFPDTRIIPEGACFSIEPGVYLTEFGMRTEIDCWIRDGKLVVTGRERQRALLLLE